MMTVDAPMSPELRMAMKVVADQRAAIDKLEAELEALKKAVVEEYGAHGVLIIAYSNPNSPERDRVKAATAAIPYEKAKVERPQEHQHLHLFAHLETARLAKRQQVIDVTPDHATPDPAA